MGEGWSALVPAQQKAGGDGRTVEVQVRPYERRRHGQVEQVSGYTQTRAAAAPEADAAHAPPVAANSNFSSAQPANGDAPRRVIILVGGAGDKTLNGSVSNSVSRFRDAGQPDPLYFDNGQKTAILQTIDSLPPGTEIVLVGHSWGGEVAAEVAADLARAGRQLDLPVTVDPVGGRRGNADFLSAARQGAKEWININAVGGSSFDISNWVAGVGGAYNDRPRGYADRFIAAPNAHNQFVGMLSTPDASGHTVLDIIRGRVPSPAPRRAVP